ncbi:RNA polymerase sigma factor [Kordia sp.]|uniref:RNA polymerase sigma factor n=1 Tax=Kordia sp. TaxID=1965332 RepID=UPI003D6B4F14
MSQDFYISHILPHAAIIIKICRAYSNSQEDFEDYYQEVCLQIWRSRNNFSGKSEWSTWIYRVSLNVCLTLLKKNKKNTNTFVSDAIPQDILDDSQAFFKEASLNELYKAIKQLNEINRAIIVLYLEEKSYQEIASIMGMNVSTIGVRINRIKEQLKKLVHGKIN